MKKSLLLLLILFLSFGVYATDGWTRTDGEYFSRIVWKGDLNQSGVKTAGEGNAYVGVFGSTYGLPSPTVVIRLYPDGENYLTNNDYRRAGNDYSPDIAVSFVIDGVRFNAKGYVSNDKINMEGPSCVKLCGALYQGYDADMTINVGEEEYLIRIPADGFREEFDGYISRDDFNVPGRWYVDHLDNNSVTYASITEYSNEDEDIAIYFELSGNPELAAGNQTIQITLFEIPYGEHLAYSVSETEKSFITYGPYREWPIEANLFGKCYVYPSMRNKMLRALENSDRITIKVVDSVKGKEYTVDLDRDKFVKHFRYPYEFPY